MTYNRGNNSPPIYGNIDRGQIMHLAQRLAAVVLTLGLSAGLVGCDFHLKGTDTTATPLVYDKIQLIVPREAEDLERVLSTHLSATGVQLSNANDAYVLRILDYRPVRQELRGTLIEVILRLSVTFQIEDREGNPITQPRTLVANRTYQYNLATVNSDDQQYVYLSKVLLDDMAQQISRQIAANRLPKAQINPQVPATQNNSSVTLRNP